MPEDQLREVLVPAAPERAEQTSIHPGAFVDPEARLGEGVLVGPGAVIGPDVHLGDGVRVGPNAVLTGRLTVGEETRFFPCSVIGEEPQDISYAGEPTAVEIGPRCTFREGVSVHRGTAKGGGVTRIGADVYLMANSHIGHDCVIGDGTIIVNGTLMAGHVEVGDEVMLSGHVGLHQFVRIGRMAMIGGMVKITQDVPPFALLVDGKDIRGINRVGIRRSGFSRAAELEIKDIYRVLFQNEGALAGVLPRIHEIAETEEARELAEFLAQPSRRGYCSFRAPRD